MRRPRWNNSIKAFPMGKYHKEIKRYLFLLLIPVLLLAVLYINVNQVVKKQARNYAELMINHFYAQSSSMLHEMQIVSNAILRSSDISRILECEDVNALDSLYICDIISDCLKESPYVQHAYLICHNSDSIYTDEGLFNGNSLPALLDKIGTAERELSALSKTDYHMLNQNRTAPYYIRSIRDESGTLKGTLIVSLQMMEFLRIFHSMDADLCTIFNDDVYISSYIKGININDFDWRNEASISELLGTQVSCVYLEQDDYTYLVAVSRENYNQPLHVILKWFFIYAFAALSLGYLCLYLVSRRRYQQISAMAEALPVSYAGDQSYEHIYENIRSSLLDYSKQREHLQIENQEHLLHSLLATGQDREITVEQFQSAGVNPHNRYYYVATFFTTELFHPEQGKDQTHGTASFLHLLLRSTITELAAQHHISCSFCGIPRTGFAVLYGDDAACLKESVLNFSENVVAILTNSYAMKIQATICSPVSSVLQLPEAYQETYLLHNFAKSINSSAPVISQEALQCSSSVLLNGDFMRQEQILINTILVRKYDAIPSMVESILSAHVSPLRKNYTLAQSRLMSISNILVEGVRMASIPGFPESENAKAISEADSVQQLVLATNQIYGFMAEKCCENSSEADPLTIACAYINQNLSDMNLNVTAVCEATNVSVQRLTRMFQAQFNMAIAEYMNACRIKMAKELLPDKQLTISQISQQVGYGNADTFTRNFRKIEGINPTEYRKLLSEH